MSSDERPGPAIQNEHSCVHSMKTTFIFAFCNLFIFSAKLVLREEYSLEKQTIDIHVEYTLCNREQPYMYV
jgi:hypothetical protein